MNTDAHTTAVHPSIQPVRRSRGLPGAAWLIVLGAVAACGDAPSGAGTTVSAGSSSGTGGPATSTTSGDPTSTGTAPTEGSASATSSTTEAVGVCGDGVLDPSESCDGTYCPNGKTCMGNKCV